MEKAFGYIRVSTSGQARDGYSLEYQREEIIKHASCNNFELVDIYEDKGLSGAKVDEDDLTIERKGLQEMLSNIRCNGAKIIIVLNTSRLWRGDMVKVLIHRELRRNNIDIISIEQPNYSIYNHDPNNFLVNGMLELLDAYQRLEIALKLSRGRKKKAEQGGYSGGGVAFGYSVNKFEKTIEVNEEQARVVRRIFALRGEYPDLSLSDIASIINSQSFKTAQGKQFTKVQIKRILDNEPFYRGMYSYGGVTAQGQHDVIL